MKVLQKCTFYLLVLVTSSVQADWVGPAQVLSGNWGNQPQEFYVDWGDTPAFAVYPGISDVASDGWIVVGDQGHIKLFSQGGAWVRNIAVGYENPRFVGNNIVLESRMLRFISRTGEEISEVENYRNDFIGERGDRLYLAQREPKQWRIYSPDGSLLNTVAEKPLQLGRINEDLFIYQGEKLNRVTVSFPNREWVIAGDEGSCGEYSYFVGNTGFLHCLNNQQVVRYSACGKPIATLNMPENTIETLESAPPGSGAEDNMQIVEAYGAFEIADNGDLYTSRVTQENFSVVRWTWEDSPDDPAGGPDAPVELTATPADSAVALQWIPSLQDPGCVTGYEIGRSTSAGGPYTTVTTVDTGGVDQPYTYTGTTAEPGTTYYYAVRAVSAIANSEYSNEASVSFP